MVHAAITPPAVAARENLDSRFLFVEKVTPVGCRNEACPLLRCCSCTALFQIDVRGICEIFVDEMRHVVLQIILRHTEKGMFISRMAIREVDVVFQNNHCSKLARNHKQKPALLGNRNFRYRRFRAD